MSKMPFDKQKPKGIFDTKIKSNEKRSQTMPELPKRLHHRI